ncbi:TPR Domain containing protein [Trichomonas vaginalis G3]|uniref:TPR Domain containing protein n=1 Tax=Trichomonas vaginalis (strain ATCC PRA-98 / G3) TaxID=412133 RepID=A2E067_TRIV3|nr:tetratricopeptide repeat protein 21-like protein family [Trichomonas vaginalis G3]EAY13986.1 TPR Domain containing protein [Trichomonas vaginalis G3]KAI5551811.1 tetratricopeptide repeat protein 21-like protein family [Trichomonas vaginalis G3]|eukprot:XP_001326209.1 TPR Domain containing protein [Trichomonas vaginalis G3]
MFGHIRLLCQEFLKSQGSDPTFVIWDSLANGAEGKTSAALASLEKISNRIANSLEIAVAKLWIHKNAKTPDYASISELETQIESLKSNASASSIVSAARILWLTGELQQAFDFVNPLASQPPPNKDAAALLGWIKLTEQDRNSGRYFDMANADASIQTQNVDPFVIYGKAMYFSTVSRWQESVSLFVQLAGIAEFPEASLERARLYIASNSWELAIESAQENQGHYASDTDYYFMTILHNLSQTGNLEGARENVKLFCDLVSKIEGENAAYITNVAEAIYALCWKDTTIIQTLIKLFPPLLNTNSDNSRLLQIYGELLVAANRPSEAIQYLQNAIVMNSEAVGAYVALVSAYISMKDMNDAFSQLELLSAMLSDDSYHMSVCTLKEKLNRANNLPTNVDELISAMHSHVEMVSQIFSPQSARQNSEKKLPVDLFCDQIVNIKLPDFAEAMNEAMEHCNTLEKTVADPHNGDVCDLIVRMLEYVPGSVPFSYYLAVLGFGEGRFAQVTKAIQFVLNSKWGFNASQCHLLLAQIRLQMKQFEEADAALSRAVSYDFSIRSSLRYNMILAELSFAKGQFDKALETIDALMKTGEYTSSKPPEKLSIIIFKSMILKSQGKSKESIDNIDDALTKFTSENETGQLKLTKASILADSDKIPDAISILDSFDSKSPMFTAAKKKQADIYLEKLNDKAAYIRCFKALVDQSETKTNLTLLGDAYMTVKRFDDAVGCFQRAADLDLGDTKAAIHLARGFMIVHRYDDALKEYERACANSEGDNKVLFERCHTLLKLRYYDEAEEIAQSTMDEIDVDSGDWERQYIYAQLAELMSIISLKRDGEEVSAYISEALNVYDKLTLQSRVDIPADAKLEINKKAAQLYIKSADAIINSGKSLDDAEAYLKKAADLDTGGNKALLMLAHLYSDSGRKDDAKDACQRLIKDDPKCEEAAMILAEISITENFTELENSFEANPSFFHTLVRLIEICARKGTLEKVPDYFTKCDKNLPGFKFCNGLYNFYIGEPMKAIECFHEIRNDPEWGVNAQLYSFHIYANPQRRFVWCETKPIATHNEIEAANKILRKLDMNDVDTDPLRATLLLSQNTQDSIKEALEIYNKNNSDDIATIIGRCRCYMCLDQQNNVTRNLNSIIHSEPNISAIASYVEAFLMMTQISLKSGAIDEAENYIQQATDLDKSCVKAWEMTATIFEKKKDNIGASEALYSAWELTSKNDCSIGYRLAFNLMKAQNPVEAIKVARVILGKHPNFPKIKEQILIPCCAQIRP